MIAWWFVPSSWESDYEQNIVIVPKIIDVDTNLILLVKYDKLSNNIRLEAIPALDEVEVRGGYGSYPLKSLYPLLALDKHDERTIRATYSYALQMTIDQVWVSKEDAVFAVKTPSGLSRHIVSRDITAPLSLKDRIEVSRELQKYSLMRKEYATLDAWKNTSTARYNADFRPCRVGVTNASQVSGLARYVEEAVTRIGGIVIRVDAQASREEQTKILVQPGQAACQELTQHLKVLSPKEILVIEDEAVFSRVRSELEFVIGDDLAQYLSGN